VKRQARQAGRELFGDGLEFSASPAEQTVTLDDMLNTLDDPVFGTYDFVFYPVTGRPPLDVADTYRIDDPTCYESDGVCYFYSGEADTIFQMKK